MVRVDFTNVSISRDRPERAGVAVFVKLNRRLCTQPLQIRKVYIILVQTPISWIYILKWQAESNIPLTV